MAASTSSSVDATAAETAKELEGVRAELTTLRAELTTLRAERAALAAENEALKLAATHQQFLHSYQLQNISNSRIEMGSDLDELVTWMLS
jgi:regulator of replication initiation timing